MSSSNGTLAVVGAGAKAVAVAAKAAELRAMGVDAPDVVAIERSGVAANWQAGGGWTDGNHRLAIFGTGLFFVLGLVLLRGVDVARGIAAAEAADARARG